MCAGITFSMTYTIAWVSNFENDTGEKQMNHFMYPFLKHRNVLEFKYSIYCLVQYGFYTFSSHFFVYRWVAIISMIKHSLFRTTTSLTVFGMLLVLVSCFGGGSDLLWLHDSNDNHPDTNDDDR